MYSERFMLPTIASRYQVVNSESPIVNNGAPLSNRDMDTIEEIRLENLRALVRRWGGNVGFAEAAGIKNPAQVSQWLNQSPSHETGTPRAVSSRAARAIEHNLRLERGWMDHSHAVEAPNGLPPDYRLVLDMLDRMDDKTRRAFRAAGAALAQPAKPARDSARRRAG